jgi:uncharacterized protein
MQHALRAFTPDDAKQLKQTVATFPKSQFYDLDTLLTQLAIGETTVTILSESGVPTPVVQTRVRAPQSRMAPAEDVSGAAKQSPLFAKYGTRIDNRSARELLAARIQAPEQAAKPQRPAGPHKEAADAAGGGVATIGKFLASRQGQRLEREVVRGVFGMLKKRV